VGFTNQYRKIKIKIQIKKNKNKKNDPFF